MTNFYVWQGDDISASVCANHQTANGGTTYGTVGKITIQNGDCVAVDYGASVGVYTRSGKGYEMQYPHGLMTRFCDGASIVLDGKSAANLKTKSCDKATFERMVEEQKEKYLPALKNLVFSHEEKLVQNYQNTLSIHARNQETRKAIISGALDKMESVLGKKKP